ncbi:hypothetical protein C0J00_02860 [Streptococcus pluranimalium]|uniref:Uncharacterized protein n=1 Tax=Streptococcus pluranimalium TaxID=82348 RepID=A0A2L0D6N7_9STRE|nr:hypothetical protein C0J00_02860 [Streptococcus pluranimalium]
MFGSLFKDQSLVLKKAEKPVTILKKKKDRFYLKGHPEKELTVIKLTFNPPLPYSGPGVSKGAVAGVGAYATLGRDQLKGAIIGDWLEKRRKGNTSSSEVHQMSLVLESDDGHQERIDMRVKQDSAIKIDRFFRE